MKNGLMGLLIDHNSAADYESVANLALQDYLQEHYPVIWEEMISDDRTWLRHAAWKTDRLLVLPGPVTNLLEMRKIFTQEEADNCCPQRDLDWGSLRRWLRRTLPVAFGPDEWDLHVRNRHSSKEMYSITPTYHTVTREAFYRWIIKNHYLCGGTGRTSDSSRLNVNTRGGDMARFVNALRQRLEEIKQ